MDPQNNSPYEILTHVEEREMLAVEALEALTVADDPATTQAQTVLTELQGLQDKAQAALMDAEDAAEVAQRALHDAIGARLKGQPHANEATIKTAAVAAELELRAIVEYAATLGDDLKRAEAALMEAIHENKLVVARHQWNAMSAEQRQLCQRLTKSLREIGAWHLKLQEGARDMEPIAAALGVGHTLTWAFAERRILVNHIRASIFGLIPEAQYVSGGQRDIADTPLAKIWPFAKPLNTQAAPAEDEEP